MVPEPIPAMPQCRAAPVDWGASGHRRRSPYLRYLRWLPWPN